MLVEIAFCHPMDEEHEERRGFGGMRMDGGGTVGGFRGFKIRMDFETGVWLRAIKVV